MTARMWLWTIPLPYLRSVARASPNSRLPRRCRSGPDQGRVDKRQRNPPSCLCFGRRITLSLIRLPCGLASEVEQIAGAFQAGRTNALQVCATDHRPAKTAIPSTPEVAAATGPQGGLAQRVRAKRGPMTGSRRNPPSCVVVRTADYAVANPPHAPRRPRHWSASHLGISRCIPGARRKATGLRPILLGIVRSRGRPGLDDIV
jgi:hypothetical protein